MHQWLYLVAWVPARRFTAVQLTANSGTGGTAFAYTLDDLTVPAPGSAALLLLGLPVLRGRRRGNDQAARAGRAAASG